MCGNHECAKCKTVENCTVFFSEVYSSNHSLELFEQKSINYPICLRSGIASVGRNRGGGSGVSVVVLGGQLHHLFLKIMHGTVLVLQLALQEQHLSSQFRQLGPGVVTIVVAATVPIVRGGRRRQTVEEPIRQHRLTLEWVVSIRL